MKKWVFFAIVFALPVLALEEEELSWEGRQVTAQEINGWLQQAIEAENWWAVADYADILSYCFPTSPLAQECPFLVGEAFIKLDQLELANRYFTAYLNRMSSPKHFEKAIEYKFWIAEQFFSGVKKRLLNSHKLPKWASGKEDALQIYEEVITAHPHSEIAATSLLHKGILLAEFEDYKMSLETFDLLIRRFPKLDVAAEAFVEKTKVYLQQCKNESLDPGLLDLAEVNLDKFRLAFPREERIVEAEKILFEIRELFAKNLFETGCFFQKTHKTPAAIIYYTKTIAKYPESQAASLSRQRLETLQADGQL